MSDTTITRKARPDWRELIKGAGELLDFVAVGELAFAKPGESFSMVCKTAQDRHDARTYATSGMARLVSRRPSWWPASLPSDPLAQHRAVQAAMAAADAAHVADVNRARGHR